MPQPCLAIRLEIGPQLFQPRAYPTGLGESINQVYVQQLQSPAHGDLRFRIVPDESKTDVQLFTEMEIGDTWPEARLKEVFDFLLGCKHVRTICWSVSCACNSQ